MLGKNKKKASINFKVSSVPDTENWGINTGKCYKLNAALLNCQSVRNKTMILNDIITENSLDILCLTETWLDELSHSVINELTPRSHIFHHVPREDGNHGGVGICISRKFSKVKVSPLRNLKTFEGLNIKFHAFNEFFNFFIIYRPPSSSKPSFINDFLNLFDDPTLQGEVIIAGDFNLWVDDMDDTYGRKFIQEIDLINLVNNVHEPTVDSGHILDLILTRNDSDAVHNLEVEPECSISDHRLIFFKIKIPRKENIRKNITCRNKTGFNPENYIDNCVKSFEAKLASTCNCQAASEPHATGSNLHCFTNNFKSIFRNEYDSSCPVVIMPVSERENFPWYNGKIKHAIRQRRQAERKLRQVKSNLFSTPNQTLNARKNYVFFRNRVSKLKISAKQSHYNKVIEENFNNPKKLHAHLNILLGKNKKRQLPEEGSSDKLSNDFVISMKEKTERIRSGFSNNMLHIPARVDGSWTSFPPLSREEFKKVFIRTKKTFCPADPFPVSDLVSAPNFERIIDIYYKIVSWSLREGIFPESEKTAFVTPLLKSGLDKNLLDSYRPVSNISFLSKLIENSVLVSLKNFIHEKDLLPSTQSAYRENHSVETALLRIHNDCALNMNIKKFSLIVSLDSSAAFDTVDHDLFLARLNQMGISGKVLDWFESYLHDRRFAVRVEDSISNSVPLKYGVPQGSAVGPFCYSLYTINVASLLDRLNVNYHMFADDIQLIFQINPESIENDLIFVQYVLSAIAENMYENYLKLNPTKTAVMYVGNRSGLGFSPLPVLFDGENINPSKNIKILGVTFDENLSFEKHISNVVKTTKYHIREIYFIKKFITSSALKKLTYSVVHTRLDFCNGLMRNLPNFLLQRVRVAFNSAARCLGCLGPREHITLTLIELHWLPVKARIDYKYSLIIFKILKYRKPSYLLSLLSEFTTDTDITLRKQDDPYLLKSWRAKNKWGERSFLYNAARVYNDLPVAIKSIESVETFKKSLKTYYFSIAFENGSISQRYMSK